MNEAIWPLIISAVIFFFLREAVAVALVWAGVIIGGIVTAATKSEGPGLVVLGVGIMLALIWQIVAIIWIIADVVQILALL